MNIREQELFYAVLEGKHGAIDDDKDRGRFFMSMNMHHGGDTEFWMAFACAYHDKLEEIENGATTTNSSEIRC